MTNILQGNVVDFDDDFNGIVVLDDGCKVAIPGAIVGETVQFHIEHRSMHEPKAWGRCDGLVKTSNARILKTKCRTCWPTAGMCAGCPIMHIDDSTQAQMKRTAVERALAKAGITYIDEVPFVRADSVFHYRNRTDLVASEIPGRLVLGSYKPRSHDVIETKVCPILRPPLNQALAFIVSTARKMHIFASKPGVFFATGALRYVSLFANAEGKVLVDLVVNSAYGKVPNWIRPFANKLKEFSPIVGVSYSINDSENNAIRVSPSTVVWGCAAIEERHGDVVSRFSASGFTQLNTEMAARIYREAAAWYDRKPHVVWDLYCGAGAFGRTFAPSRALYGAEFSASAIRSAIEMSKSDDFETHFEVMNLDSQWPMNWATPDVICLDPPRKGLSPNVVAHLRQDGPPTIIYMSCHPATFARDAVAMADRYVIQKIAAFDMMPQTKHVEVLALMHRN